MYSLCVFRLLQPQASRSGHNNVHFCPSILLHCRPHSRELGLGFINPVRTGEVLDVCLCFGGGGVGEEWVWGLVHGLELCLCEL